MLDSEYDNFENRFMCAVCENVISQTAGCDFTFFFGTLMCEYCLEDYLKWQITRKGNNEIYHYILEQRKKITKDAEQIKKEDAQLKKQNQNNQNNQTKQTNQTDAT